MRPDRILVVNLHLDPQVARVHLLLEDARQRPVREAVLAHPPQVLRRQVRLGHDPQRRAQEAQRARGFARACARAPLRDADQVHGRRHALDDRQRRETRAMRPKHITGQRVAAAAGDVGDGELGQRAPGVRPLGEAVEDLVREPVAAARDHDVVVIDGERGAKVDGLARAGGGVDRQRHARGVEEGLDLVVPFFLRAAWAGVGVYEDIGAFATRGGAVGSVEEGGGPLGDGIVVVVVVLGGCCGGGGSREGEFGGAQLGLGDVLGVVDG